MEKSIVAVNPQASLCELSWLGGIVDGEGCLTVDKRTNHKGRQQQCVTPLASIVNTDEVLMARVQTILQNNGVAFYFRIHPAKGTWRPKHEIIISGLKRVCRYLDIIEPYLVAKANRAKLLRRFCYLRLNNTGSYSEEEKNLCREIWRLNGRGTKHW